MDVIPEAKSLLVCGVCFEAHTVEFAALPCGHTLCCKCAKTTTKNSPVCPFCRKKFKKDFEIRKIILND
ncbi:E3 ubiquitin-protein ligase RNF168 [Nilaparvata lugens]|uniref:E3 ubiquitin-protein ligase RNF168 n=1 Tax=Nilaparvata lugens TaxID=108931 RepID=UPI000B999FC0|nr:E3 ubiquitin-protein ligase RNF168 [Nilaparvata lugens]